MRNSIKEALNNGLRCYAECGGLMYLTKSIDGAEMVDFFHGESIMTNKLQRFGYCKVKIDKKYFDERLKPTEPLKLSEQIGIGKGPEIDAGLEIDKKFATAKEFEINAHEFHKSQVNLDEGNVYDVEKSQYNGEIIKWRCGYFKKNTLAGYAHMNFLGNIELLEALIGVK
jgi:cobyrinic acid a,c-diamide synthase